MKNIFLLCVVCLLASIVVAVSFWYGSSQSPGTTLAGPHAMAGEKNLPPAAPLPHSATPARARTSVGGAPSLAEMAAGASPTLDVSAATRRWSGATSSADRPSTDSTNASDPHASVNAPPATGEGTPDRPPVSGTFAADRLVGPRGVTVPLAFQNVDLFVNTAGGFLHVPVNFNSASNPASQSTVQPKPGDPGTLIVDEATAAALEAMRQDFTSAVGGLGQDGADPQYRKRWETEQSISDQRFRARFGTQAFLSYQTAAAHKAEAERQSAAKK